MVTLTTTASLPPSEQATESPSEVSDNSAEQKMENGNKGDSNESPKE